MITTLMMLLGLSGAGAGIYNVMKKPEDEGEPTGSRSRRRRKKPEEGEGREAPPTEKGATPPELPWGGRGGELPVSNKQPSKKVANLPPIPEDDGEEMGLLPDAPIFPPSPPGAKSGPPKKSKRSLPSLPEPEPEEELPTQRLTNKPPKPELEFGVDEIISRNSKYSFHRRPLLNAEALIEKDQWEEAREIFQRTESRIQDKDIKKKIQRNIEVLSEYLDEVSEDEPYYPEERDGGPGGDVPPGEPQFGPRPPQGKKSPTRPKGTGFSQSPGAPGSAGTTGAPGFPDFADALKEVSRLFSESIVQALQYASQIPQAQGGASTSQAGPQAPAVPNSGTIPPQPSAGNPSGPLPFSQSTSSPMEGFAAQPTASPSPVGGQPKLPPLGIPGADFLQPTVYQFLKENGPHPSYAKPVSPEEQIAAYQEQLQALNKGLVGEGGAPIPPPPGSGIVGPFYLPNPEELRSNLQNLGKSAEDLSSGIQQASQKLRDISEIPLPTEAFFHSDWKKYRDLPLTDRRSGVDRRKNPLGLEAGKKDRRSGKDRRKSDLFQERESYLKEKALEKLKEEATEAQKGPEPPSLNDILAPYLPPVPAKMELPTGMDLRKDELAQALQDASHEVVPKVNLPSPKEKDLSLPEPAPTEENTEDWIEKDEDWIEKAEALRKEMTLPDPADPEIDLPKLDLPKPQEPIEEAEPLKINLPEPFDPSKVKDETVIETEDPIQVELVKRDEEDLIIGLPDPADTTKEELEKEDEIEVEGNLDEKDIEDKIEEEPEKVIHGVLELKPPEADDAPFLTLTYDFGKIPHAFRLSKNYSIMEYSYYKYKPMLLKAQEFARRKMLKNALNYYRVIKSQNIPPELRKMINRNIRDITEFMEKFLMAKGN